MPSLQELIGIVLVVLAVWLLLKMARVALRLFFFLIGLTLIVGLLFFVFVR